jgi:hypothetical protein
MDASMTFGRTAWSPISAVYSLQGTVPFSTSPNQTLEFLGPSWHVSSHPRNQTHPKILLNILFAPDIYPSYIWTARPCLVWTRTLCCFTELDACSYETSAHVIRVGLKFSDQHALLNLLLRSLTQYDPPIVQWYYQFFRLFLYGYNGNLIDIYIIWNNNFPPPLVLSKTFHMFHYLYYNNIILQFSIIPLYYSYDLWLPYDS